MGLVAKICMGESVDPGTGTCESIEDGAVSYCILDRHERTEMQLHYQNLKTKLYEQGGKLSKVELKEFKPGYYGIIATDDIVLDEVIANIPRVM